VYRTRFPGDSYIPDDVPIVAPSRTVRFLRSTVGITAALAGQEVGLIELDDVWLFHFCGQDLGLFEVGEAAISPLDTHHREGERLPAKGHLGISLDIRQHPEGVHCRHGSLFFQEKSILTEKRVCPNQPPSSTASFP